ncbi:hypothetical protein ACOSQ2_028660 [Xanthoceras sorbifolium]
MIYKGDVSAINPLFICKLNTNYSPNLCYFLLCFFFYYFSQILFLINGIRAFRFMDTRSKTHAEFRVKVTEALARHDTNFNELNQNFGRLQAMRLAQSNRTPDQFHCTPDREVNPFAAADNFPDRPSTSNPPMTDRNHTNLKLNFPTYAGEGEDPTGWIFKAEQYFKFKNIDASQNVQLASFHLSNATLQWYRWFTKNKGPLRSNVFVKALIHRFGLKDDIRWDVHVKQPKSLSETISISLLTEERNQFQRKPGNTIRSAAPSYYPRPQQNSKVGLLGASPSQRTPQANRTQDRNILPCIGCNRLPTNLSGYREGRKP